MKETSSCKPLLRAVCKLRNAGQGAELSGSQSHVPERVRCIHAYLTAVAAPNGLPKRDIFRGSPRRASSAAGQGAYDRDNKDTVTPHDVNGGTTAGEGFETYLGVLQVIAELSCKSDLIFSLGRVGTLWPREEADATTWAHRHTLNSVKIREDIMRRDSTLGRALGLWKYSQKNTCLRYPFAILQPGQVQYCTNLYCEGMRGVEMSWIGNASYLRSRYASQTTSGGLRA